MGGGMAMTYRLIGGKSSDLQEYANSQVEVTGTLVGHDGMMDEHKGTSAGTSTSAGSTTGTGSTSSTAGTASGTGTASSTQSGERDHAPALRVTSVRQLSSTCPGGAER
jgi:hypothetical protein